MSRIILVLALFLLFTYSCSTEKAPTNENPASQGFNEAESDLLAIQLADSVVVAHGGRKAWDETTYLKWNFFGSRRHVWNKKTGDVVIEGILDTFLVHMNINDMTGSVNFKGQELSNPDSLSKYLEMGKEMWINDSYWVFLPFKLKDSGVTLKYLESIPANDSLGKMEKISLTFNDVGVTPDNKYVLSIESDSYKIHQWAFYKNANDSLPGFTTTWSDYRNYGNIVLANKRENYMLSEIAVGDSLAKYFK